ncbi:MAG: hypothetical protein GY944_12445, partial [bacterium]|nr:hypothetical protein [bacterium]
MGHAKTGPVIGLPPSDVGPGRVRCPRFRRPAWGARNATGLSQPGQAGAGGRNPVRAMEIGLVSRVVEPDVLLDTATELAREMAG